MLDAASKSSFHEVSGVLNRGGAYVTLLASPALLTGMLSSVFSSKRCGVIVVKSRTADLDQLAEWLAGGQLNASVDRICALSDISAALKAMEAGRAPGKIAVRIGD